jgi:hypothetical protein
MVIIKRDDYISFLNSTGVKMPTTPISNELSIQSTGNNGNLVPPNNNNDTSLNNANIGTIKADSNYQQKFQQFQQFTQQQNQQNNQNVTNQVQPFAKAQLICRPNSHPFPVSISIFFIAYYFWVYGTRTTIQFIHIHRVVLFFLKPINLLK